MFAHTSLKPSKATAATRAMSQAASPDKLLTNSAKSAAATPSRIAFAAPTAFSVGSDVNKKPSLLPKPKVKVVIPRAILEQQMLQQQQQQQEEEELALSQSATSRIPVKKRALFQPATVVSVDADSRSAATTKPDKSIAMLNAEKRAAWHAAPLRSLEKVAMETQTVIKSINRIADELGEVETCQEKIISLELQDPEKDDTPNASLTLADVTLEDEEPPESFQETARFDANDNIDTDDDDDDVDDVDDDDDENDSDNDNEELDDEEEEEEEDASSIVTVHANNEKLFLRNDQDPSAMDELEMSKFASSSDDSMSSTKVTIKATPLTLHQTLAREVLVLPASAAAAATSNAAQTIVEVVSPLIKGDGLARSIVVGRAAEVEFPSFDDIRAHSYETQKMLEHECSTASGVLRSETFVLPLIQQEQQHQQLPQNELSLNAKMKTVLEELLENDRVKLNLQKSLEEDDYAGTAAAAAAYGDAIPHDDEIDFGANREFGVVFGDKASDNNGNQQKILEQLIKDSNRNTIKKLASVFKDDDEPDDDDESEESEDSDSNDDDDNDDDDDDAVQITYVDGCKVIENLNTGTPLKLQKSQTYTTMTEASNAMQQAVEELKDDAQSTIENLQAEQKRLEEISTQLRQSFENLLLDDRIEDSNAEFLQNEKTSATIPVAAQQKSGGKKSQKVEVVAITKTSGIPQRVSGGGGGHVSHVHAGEVIFNKLLNAGGNLKQLFDNQTDETVTTTTSTDNSAGSTTVTKTTTISSVATSGIPRAIVKETSESASSGSAAAGEGTSKGRTAAAKKTNNNKNNKQQQNKQQQQQQQKRKGKNGKK